MSIFIILKSEYHLFGIVHLSSHSGVAGKHVRLAVISIQRPARFNVQFGTKTQHTLLEDGKTSAQRKTVFQQKQMQEITKHH